MPSIGSVQADQAAARAFNDRLANEQKAARQAQRQESEQNLIEDRAEIKSAQRANDISTVRVQSR